MANLTSRQLTELGDAFLELAQSVGNYRLENRAAMTRAQNEKLKDLHWSLLKNADDMYTSSAKVVMNDVRGSLEKIKEVTGKMNRTYQKLKTVQKAIDVATAAVSLGGSIFSKNPENILKAVKELEDELKNIR